MRVFVAGATGEAVLGAEWTERSVLRYGVFMARAVDRDFVFRSHPNVHLDAGVVTCQQPGQQATKRP
jgi:hypothetical protein